MDVDGADEDKEGDAVARERWGDCLCDGEPWGMDGETFENRSDEEDNRDEPVGIDCFV